MYCKNCGQKLDDDSLFCSYCGTNVKEQQETIEVGEVISSANVEEPKNAKCWDVFAFVGFGVGIAALAGFFFSTLSMILSVVGLVFSILGFKSYKYKGKAKLGLIFSICAMVIATIIFILSIAAILLTFEEFANLAY